MSGIKCSVGKWQFHWKTIPRGQEGVAQLELKPGEAIDVHWRRDRDGIWISTPHGTFGFDLQGELDDNGKPIYRVLQRGAALEWTGASATYGSEAQLQGARGTKAKATRVRAQMPGKIIRILAEPGQAVQKDQPLMVMEAMKMENEIRAPQAGKIATIKVTEGQAVETGADLILMEAGQGN